MLALLNVIVVHIVHPNRRAVRLLKDCLLDVIEIEKSDKHHHIDKSRSQKECRFQQAF